jgi:hypothetical protein
MISQDYISNPDSPWAWYASLRRSSSSGQDRRRRGYIRDRIATS